MKIFQLAMALFLGLLASSPAFAQENENGEADLAKAVDLKITAGNDRELDEIADLCESAIEKGLDKDSETYARQLWSSTLYDHAESYSERIFSGEYGSKWPPYRRRALTRLQRAVEVDPTFADAYILIARLNLELPRGDKESARTAVDKVIELGGDDKVKVSDGYLLRARLADDDKDIMENLNKAIEANDENIDALKVRGAKYLLMNDDGEKMEFTDKAMEDFKRVAELEPDSPTGYSVIAETLMDLERHDEALEYADKVIAIDPEKTEGYMLRSRILANADKIEEAIAEASLAVEKDTDDFAALLFRAGMYYDQKDYKQALSDIQKTLELAPRNIRALYMRSFIYVALEEFDKGIADMSLLFRNAQFNFQQNPSDENAKRAFLSSANDFANVHVASKRSRIAIELYNQILSEDSENVSAIRGRAGAYLNIGEHDKAIEDYKDAYELMPEDDNVCNNYSWLLSTSPDEHIRDGKLALELALKAAELTEYKEAHILSTLASAYAETGDFEKAREWSEKSIELAEDDKQRDGLQEELETYKNDKPYREREEEEDLSKKDDSESDDDSKKDNEEDEDKDGGGDNKESDEKKDKKKDKDDGDGQSNR